MPVYTVGQLTRYLRESMEADSLLRDLWVRGEVSNLSASAAGHFYFTLKEANTQLRCVMFRGGRGGERLDAGAAVVAHGRVSVYEARGELQLYVDIVQPEGVGERHMELERLKLQLETEGLFSPERKRPLPPFPRRIGVVTSPTGSVWHDIQNVIGRRYPLVELALAPTSVQGDIAAPAIVEALQAVNEQDDIDLVIVARGGGSLEELWPFNEEIVARAIFGSRVPVVSAVGHETDVTVADLVADLRAPTPSAAAELVVPDSRELLERVTALRLYAHQMATAEVGTRAGGVERAVWRLERSVPDIPQWRQRVDDLSHAYARALSTRLALDAERTRSLGVRLVALDPAAVLGRGYAFVQRAADMEPVTSVAHVSPGDDVLVTVSDGTFPGRVMPTGTTATEAATRE